MSNANTEMSFEIINDSCGIDVHILSGCTISVAGNGFGLYVQTTCKLYRPSLNCEIGTEDEIDDDLQDEMIDKAEDWLIEYCNERFVESHEDTEINKLLNLSETSKYEILYDTEKNEFVVLQHDTTYINKDTSPYTIPYKVRTFDDTDEEREELKEGFENDTVDELFNEYEVY